MQIVFCVDMLYYSRVEKIIYAIRYCVIIRNYSLTSALEFDETTSPAEEIFTNFPVHLFSFGEQKWDVTFCQCS